MSAERVCEAPLAVVQSGGGARPYLPNKQKSGPEARLNQRLLKERQREARRENGTGLNTWCMCRKSGTGEREARWERGGMVLGDK